MIRCMRNYVDKGVVKSTKAKEGYSQQRLSYNVLKTTTVQRKSALTLPFWQDVASTLYVLAKESF